MNIITTPFKIEDIKVLKSVGASAMMISIPYFSTRAAAYFEESDLAEIKDVCKENEVKMYVQVNRLFVEEELSELRRMLSMLKELDVDGIYYGDEAVLYEAKKLDMESKLIYNPDTLITNHLDAKYYLDEGIHMVSLAKELTVDEMVEIAGKITASQLEAVIHGRLNMFHSKRELLTNYMEFLGKDKDLRDQKNLMLKEEKREDLMPVVEDDLGTNIYTGFTLISFNEIKQLLDAGIVNLRIDGIFHDVEWLCDVITMYQDVVDGKLDPMNAEENYKEKYPSDAASDGFWHTNTILVK